MEAKHFLKLNIYSLSTITVLDFTTTVKTILSTDIWLENPFNNTEYNFSTTLSERWHSFHFIEMEYSLHIYIYKILFILLVDYFHYKRVMLPMPNKNHKILLLTSSDKGLCVFIKKKKVKLK